MDINLPNISAGGSVTPTALPRLFDIFSTPLRPSSNGRVSATCGLRPYSRMMWRPTSRLNNWSAPPSSKSAFIQTES